MAKLICPYCEVEAIRKYSKYGYFWSCSNWPKCAASVGCHPGTCKPLGTLANRELKDARMKVHAKIDPYWKTKQMKRKDVYRILRKSLDISIKECHVGMFDLEMCERALTVNFEG